MGLLILLLTLQPSFAQNIITIPDSSFENSDPFTNQFFTWFKCQGQPTPWLAGENIGNNYVPSGMNPTQGNYYAHIIGGDIGALDSINQIIGVKLSTNLKKSKEYVFFLDASCVVIFKNNTNGDVGQIKLLLGKNLCEYNQIAWLSPPLDSVWHRYKVEFVPDDDYQFLSLEGWCVTPNKAGDTWVDNLSSIYEEAEQPVLPPINNVTYNSSSKKLEIVCNATTLTNTTLVLYNMLGQQVAMQSFENNATNYMDVATLPAAIYLLELKAADGKKLWYQKVMKW